MYLQPLYQHIPTSEEKKRERKNTKRQLINTLNTSTCLFATATVSQSVQYNVHDKLQPLRKTAGQAISIIATNDEPHKQAHPECKRNKTDADILIGNMVGQISGSNGKQQERKSESEQTFDKFFEGTLIDYVMASVANALQANSGGTLEIIETTETNKTGKREEEDNDDGGEEQKKIEEEEEEEEEEEKEEKKRQTIRQTNRQAERKKEREKERKKERKNE